ncbi:MAG: DUF3644 domain-containing protein [Thermodesulfobacteriota bacterium]
MNEKALKNLRLLAELRDSAVHFYSRSPKFTETLHQIGAAALKNFVAAVRDWFDRDLSGSHRFILCRCRLSHCLSSMWTVLC